MSCREVTEPPVYNNFKGLTGSNPDTQIQSVRF